MRTDARKQPQMRRSCDNKQMNIVPEALRIACCRALFAYCIMFTNGRAGLLKLDWGEAIGDIDFIVFILCL